MNRREEGAIAIMIALMLVVFMAAVALTVDVGGLYLRRRSLVNGADAAALSAARTCARLGTVSDPFATPEQAADHQVQANAPITSAEVAGTNITAMTECGAQSGHVTVGYTSQQALYFAPVLGFDRQSAVTTTATASWGLGSNNPIPIVLSDLLGAGACPMPPQGTPSIGQTCAFWYDNDSLGGGNFAFLTLKPDGWDVSSGANCNQSGGTSTLTAWINGSRPASVALNWTDPTYVCSDSGIRGVGNGSQVWSALEDLQGRTRDFPINWEGPGAPVTGAPDQGTVWANNTIDKYDIIGFAALTIVDVVTPQEAAGAGPQDDTCSHRTGNTQIIAPGTYSWIDFGTQIGCPSNKLPPSLPVDAVTAVSVGALPPGPLGYTFDNSGITLNAALPPRSNVSFTWHIDPTYGPCGPPPPSNNSAKCLITNWQGSTLTGDYQDSLDNVRVVRLCDLVYGTCLDQ